MAGSRATAGQKPPSAAPPSRNLELKLGEPVREPIFGPLPAASSQDGLCLAGEIPKVCVCMYAYACVCIYTCVCVYVYIHVYVYMCVRVCLSVCAMSRLPSNELGNTIPLFAVFPFQKPKIQESSSYK